MAVTGGIVAFDDLLVELHRAFPALGAWDADATVHKPVLQGEKFPDDAARILLDALAEVLGAVLAPLDPGKRLFPLARHGDIGNLLVFQQVVDEQPFFGRDKLLVQTDHILTSNQRLDDVGTGGWGSYTTIFQCLAYTVIINTLPAVLHLRKKCGLCMDGHSLRLTFCQSPARN